MPDESAKGPILPETKRIPESEIQRQLLDRVLENTTSIRNKVDAIDGKVDDLDTRMRQVETNQSSWNQALYNIEMRVEQMEGRQAAYEEWRAKNSERVKDVDTRGSKANADQDQAIGQLHNKVDAVDSKVDAVENLAKSAIAKIDANTAVTTENAKVTLELKKKANSLLDDPKTKALLWSFLGLVGTAVGWAMHYLSTHMP